MNIRSMTGYGRGESEAEGFRVIVEIRSVNHRYSEMVVRLPAGWGSHEEKVKKLLRQSIQRGRIDVTVTVEGEESDQRRLTVDDKAVEALWEAAQMLKEKWGVKGELTLSELLNHPKVIKEEELTLEPQRLEESLFEAVRQAASSLLEMRKREGKALAEDLDRRIGILKRYLIEIQERSPQVVKEYQKKLQERMRELLGDVELDSERLLTEAAVFADKSDIQEELTRLFSHLSQLKDALKQREPVGRRLDFLLQESNREVNTIGSKANDAWIAERIVHCKSELEKMREQVQNIE
ncbi:YicC/YloC family endoribonuclease [Melghirimyces algeriensis]|uniref:YicC/YloC family endoribonuclease n=1 Tax=Melghirimyces algeriensis TaxID=910412 RepID=UPI00163DC3A4|nr:YicC/YloC family endoribonuclease [Melghirimyces algeriensis]